MYKMEYYAAVIVKEITEFVEKRVDLEYAILRLYSLRKKNACYSSYVDNDTCLNVCVCMYTKVQVDRV